MAAKSDLSSEEANGADPGRPGTSRPLRVGLIGCGKMGERHARAYGSIGGVELFVSDVDSQRAGRLARISDGEVVERAEDLLAREDLDAIDICVPTPFHSLLILQALKTEKDVFCEKPLCMDLSEAREIQRVSFAMGRSVTVGYLMRRHPAFQFAKKVLSGGALGKVHLALFRLGGRGSHANWKHSARSGGGAIREMLVHHLDLALWFFGRLTQVRLLEKSLQIGRRRIDSSLVDADAEDFVLVSAQNQENARLVFQSDLLSPSYVNLLEIHGNNGSLFASLGKDLPTLLNLGEPRNDFPKGQSRYRFDAVDLVALELKEFLATLRSGSSAREPLLEAVEIQKILERLG